LLAWRILDAVPAWGLVGFDKYIGFLSVQYALGDEKMLDDN
jgi:hypothetical protein